MSSASLTNFRILSISCLADWTLMFIFLPTSAALSPWRYQWKILFIFILRFSVLMDKSATETIFSMPASSLAVLRSLSIRSSTLSLSLDDRQYSNPSMDAVVERLVFSFIHSYLIVCMRNLYAASPVTSVS